MRRFGALKPVNFEETVVTLENSISSSPETHDAARTASQLPATKIEAVLANEQSILRTGLLNYVIGQKRG